MYFWNCSGYDYLKGQNLCVVGSPFTPNEQVLLFSAILGYKTNNTNMKRDNYIYNGCQFEIRSYEDEELRKIHFALMESELIQAVGRARTLRENCLVFLFSRFPLKQTDQFISNYPKKLDIFIKPK